MSREKLFSLLRPDVKNFSFLFRFGNDEYSYRKWQRKTSHYQLFLVLTSDSIRLDEGRTGKDVHDLEIALINKYTKWINQFVITNQDNNG